LLNKYGATRFWETGDSFIVGNYPQKLLQARPKHLSHVTWRVYTSPDQINEEVVDTLVALNCHEIFVGVESVNDEVLARAGKSYRRKDIERAIDLISGRGLKLHIPFLYGLPGETEEIMQENYKFAEKSAARTEQMKAVVSLALPLPGTQLFENLRGNENVRREYQGDLDKDDFFDYRELVRLQCKYFTSITLDQAESYIQKTLDLFPWEGEKTSFGINNE